MPIYEYECSQCGNIVEALQRFSDKPLSKCARCSGKLHRLISQSAFHLKGSGWYVTDYAGKSNKPAAKPKSAEAKTADSAPPAEKTPTPKPTDS